MIPVDSLMAPATAVAQLAVGFVFALAAVWKVRRFREFRATVFAFALIDRRLVSSAAILILAAEGTLAAMLIGGAVRSVALPGAAALLALFGLAVGLNLARGRAVKCGCFGNSERISVRTLWRIALLSCATLLASVAPPATESVVGLALPAGLLLVLAAAAFLLLGSLVFAGAALADLVVADSARRAASPTPVAARYGG